MYDIDRIAMKCSMIHQPNAEIPQKRESKNHEPKPPTPVVTFKYSSQAQAKYT